MVGEVVKIRSKKTGGGSCRESRGEFNKNATKSNRTDFVFGKCQLTANADLLTLLTFVSCN